MKNPPTPASLAFEHDRTGSGRLPLTALAGLLFPLGLFLATATAAEKFDLERATPVPPTEPIPVMDFFRPPVLEEPKLNPSGTHVAAIISGAENRRLLLVHELGTQKSEFAGGADKKDIDEVHWLNDSRLIFSLAAPKMSGFSLLATEVGSVSDAYPLLQYYGSSLIAVPLRDRLRPLVWLRYEFETVRDRGVAAINTDLRYLRILNLLSPFNGYDPANSPIRNIVIPEESPFWDVVARSNNKHIAGRFPEPQSGTVYRYLADREGQLAFAFTAQEGQLAMHRLADGHWVKCPVDLEQVDIIGCGDRPGQVVVVGPRQEGKPRALQLLDAATGRLGAVLLQDNAYDFAGSLYRHPATQEILGARFERNGPRTAWFNEDYRNLQKTLDNFFPGQVVQILGSNEAQKLFLVATFSDRQPPVYNWVDLEKATAGLIKNSAPWIDPQRMQPMSIIKFTTRDGRQLDAYLTLPTGASKANPSPLVVLPHNGPWTRDGWGFDGEVQFLANRGYAVLQPNYRGSTGYGWMFPEEDEWDLRKMHEDVTDATKAVIASGLIDGGRIAIMGESFGGYLAISGVVNEPALYRCAVTVAGVFDWDQQIKDQTYDQSDSSTLGRKMRKLGAPKPQRDEFDAISPGRHVDRIHVPVFVSGGWDNKAVGFQQSRTLITALEKYQVPHETHLVGVENPGLDHLKNQVELYTRIAAFLAKHLAPATAAVPATSTP